jgi:threonine aldolase
MRKAIAEAVVGDDVFGDDPTAIELEKRISKLFGKEASVFVPSGTMGNQIALASITEPGDEVILDRNCHIFNYEVAATPALSGVQFNPLDGDRGVITAEQIAPHIRPRNIHQPLSRAITIENTHNRAAGRVWPLDEMKRIRVLAEEHGMKVHLDGARLANAVVKSGISFETFADCADTVSICFSKGLGAPVGSAVAGDEATMAKARRKRKQFGGGMRQVGIVAVAALYALDHHVERLSIDHSHAARLGEAVAATEGLELVFPVETNMVIFRADESWGTHEAALGRLRERGILAGPSGPNLRMVTHLDVSSEDVDFVIEMLVSV